MTPEEEILTWTDTEQEDALLALYDSQFANIMIKEGSKPVLKVINDKRYRNAIEQFNLNGGFVY